MTSTFAVCCTADIPAEVVDRFLSETYAYAEELAEELAAGLGPCLAVLGDANDIADSLTTATPAGSAANLPPSSFVGITSATEAAQQLGSPANRYFLIMDTRSAEDKTVLLVHTTQIEYGGGDDVQTVRVTFKSSQILMCALEVGSQGFEEVQIHAASSPDGVYGPERDDVQPEKGGPAPRKVLGAEG